MTTYEYTLTRTIDAPVEKVWTTWTEPKHYSVWFNAPLETVSLDVRTGGKWSSTLITPDGSEVPMAGCYAEVVENKRMVLAMEFPGKDEPETMEFELTATSDGKTEVLVHQACDTQEGCDQSKGGSEYLLDSFAAYIATI
jgi:uncharacterized protein YndB with AHSA1/START domain